MLTSILVLGVLGVGGSIAGGFLGAMIGGYVFGNLPAGRKLSAASAVLGVALGLAFAYGAFLEMDENSKSARAKSSQQNDADRWHRR